MIFLKLAIKSLKNRAFATILTVVSIALSVSLLLSVERAKRASEEGFTQTISKTDLIVGARSGPLQLILYTVFNMGNPTHNISYETFEKIKKNPAVSWSIPYSLGDGHRGYRVVGTNEDFFKHYHYRGSHKIEFAEGKPFNGLWDVVVGAEVARKLEYKIGDKVVIAHGVTKGEGILNHDDKPFAISGIMKATGTPLDRSVYLSLEAMEALHIDWQSGSAPTRENMIAPNQLSKSNLKVSAITAFLIGTRSKIEILKLQREINNYTEEPLLAIIPGVTLTELWNGLSYVENVLRVISWMVVLVGLTAMLIALTTTLNERRREMSILRAVGAKASHISGLLVFESTLLTVAGIILGTFLSFAATAVLKPWLEAEFGLYLVGPWLTKNELVYLSITLVGGILIGFIPALRAQNLALKDGLSIKL